MTAPFAPEGLSNWGEEEWSRFCSTFRPNGEESINRRYFTGSFSGLEVATLVGMAQGKLNAADFARVYGYGALDMIIQWKADARSGHIDQTLVDSGVYDFETLDRAWGSVAQALGLLTTEI